MTISCVMYSPLEIDEDFVKYGKNHFQLSDDSNDISLWVDGSFVGIIVSKELYGILFFGGNILKIDNCVAFSIPLSDLVPPWIILSMMSNIDLIRSDDDFFNIQKVMDSNIFKACLDIEYEENHGVS